MITGQNRRKADKQGGIMLPCFLIMGEKEADMKNDIIQNIRLDMNAPKIKSSLSVRLGDTCTRSIHVTMSNGGSVVSMENALVALIEIEKPDGNHCYNDCVISGNEIQYTITTQTVNVEGTCKCQISVTFEDGAVITSPIFDLVVYSQLVDQNKVKSKNEYTSLTEQVVMANAYANNAKASETAAGVSETNAKASEDAAKESETNALSSANDASQSAKEALESKEAAAVSEINAKAYAATAGINKQEAQQSALEALRSETAAKKSADAAGASESNAKKSETNALNSANAAAVSEKNAKSSEKAVKGSETNALSSANDAAQSAQEALSSKEEAAVSEGNALISENNASAHKQAAAQSALAALTSETAAKKSADAAGVSESNARESEKNALNSADAAGTSESNAKVSETNADQRAADADTSAKEAKKYLEDLKASGQLTLGETKDTAYYGDKGKAAYEHSFLTGNPHNTTYEEVGADKSGAANAALTSSKDYTDEKISEVNTELDKRALTSELTIHTSDKVVHITVEERTAWNESYQNAVAYTDQKIAALINGAPETLDTLKEIADAMEQNESVVEALNNAIGTKANLAEFNSHESNTTVHITAAERKKWNAYTTQIANLQKSIDTINKTLTSLGSSVTELQNKQGYPIAKEN